MKKVLFAAFLTVCATGAFAQINKGQWLVGGTVGFNSQKFGDGDENKVSMLNISPNGGYFFMDKLAAGLRLDFTSTKVKSEDDAYSDFAVAPFVRYYFLPTTEKVNLFLDGSYGFGSAGQEDKTNQSYFAFVAGPAVFLSPSVALELGIGYKSYKYKDIDDRDNRFGVNVGFQVHLGGKK
ncbi:MAG: outer membrane beta-barrel protein [Candidatus Pseudobacter hemicellulosilyticus]|uniref:Outer membrane beta-barrel protein n=1 Tax=Candidatus Pseudobacter hemicellulosilyticus TaxID=3121375 RepID=A0AAJ5WPJ8_9BACT|nr:MAG: outer membrane beta-barrel protein [Pseudobacter sp.]